MIVIMHRNISRLLLATKIFTSSKRMTDIKPIIKYVPNFDKSTLVNLPNKAKIPNRTAVIKNTTMIDVILNNES